MQSTLHYSKIIHGFVLSSNTSGIDVPSACELMKSKLRKHDAMRVIKTWCNSWATSHRMHEATRLPCLFGCHDGIDSMIHYVSCPFWLFLLVRLLPSPPSPFPLTRLALVDPSVESLLSVASSFAGYHAVKRLATKSCWTQDALTDEYRSISHATFCDAFCAEASDSGLPHMSFSTVFRDLR